MQQLIRLLNIMSDLRNPDSGCPWDLKQDYKSLVPYTLEEAYEVAEAIEQGDMEEVKKELGDLLFQVVFYAQLAKEEGLFDFDDIAGTIADKMVSRHPHVFSDHHYENEEDFLKAWEQQKEVEKKQAQLDKIAAKSKPSSEQKNPENQLSDSLMDGISKVLPAMTRAVKIQKKATHIGFDWVHAEEVLPIIKEELDELSVEIKALELNPHALKNGESVQSDTASVSKVEEELGDVLFSCVNLARKLNVDPEKALRMSNHKFIQRFRKMEQHYQFNRTQMEQAPLDQLEQVWQSIKKQ
ncbi:MAG: nucleoside triphosphate pyrophosphohydrolase [gamma proteobacterium symbiont of Bathyaustriella thionipta]|nr:nucleoside triphosphate pyrophosphohydrolase [gamma proteobacterium symbiont of Bathyaustriella thionipta]MCU7951446.1 nucleoside triphosphate pyrophosphohydrolase [gamma proteobacterium symbiont of Bathyaustriella thionipta]MCU7952510.1 nucleoside triphosphate pyrophosphohydrolase [gamma proteobacterium symbiont of Bathyaustriella thionipta]MCU7958015.1 nucleoside triphosphate pyrophosphohydrolase [gamma proteobacterium symbiont of Bathyaustriella thionipta]MCU7966395.1 nucleoside triphosph